MTFGVTPPLLLNMQWSPKVTAETAAGAASEASPRTSAHDDDDEEEDEDEDEEEVGDGGAAGAGAGLQDDDDEVACTADFAFRSGLKFQLATKVWINWPRDRSASIPVTLDLEVHAPAVPAQKNKHTPLPSISIIPYHPPTHPPTPFL